MNHFCDISHVDPVVIQYVENLIMDTEEVTSTLMETIQLYLAEETMTPPLTLEMISQVKHHLQEQHRPEALPTPSLIEVREMIEPIVPMECSVNYAIKEDMEFKRGILQEYPYLEMNQVLFLIHKYGKKHVHGMLPVLVSEHGVEWFQTVHTEYERYQQQVKQEQKQEKEMKKKLYQKYYSSIIDPTKTYRPLVVMPRKDKLTRYRENKIVTNKGEKYIFHEEG